MILKFGATKTVKFSWTRFAWLLPIFAWFGLPRIFMENDDVGFIYLLTHHFYAPYLSKPFCELFFFLRHLQSDWPWYGLIQYLILMIDWAVFLKILFDWATQNHLTSCWKERTILAGTLFFIPFFLKITYSVTSILSGGIALVGLMMILAKSHKDESRKDNSQNKEFVWRLRTILAVLGLGCLFSMCYLLRPEGIGAMVFLTPAFLYFIFKMARTFRWKQFFLLGSVFLLPIISLYGFDRQYCHYPPDQAAYQEYVINSNNTFGFGFTNEFKKDAALLQQLGWYHNDFGLYERFLYFNEKVFSPAKVNDLIAKSPAAIQKHLKALENPAFLIRRVIMTFGKVWLGHYMYTSVLMLVLVFFTLMGVDNKARYFPWIYWLILFLGSLLMQYCFRFPVRVAYPTMTCFGLALFVLPGYSLNRLREKKGVLNTLVGALFFCIVVFSFIFSVLETENLHIPQSRTKMKSLTSAIQNQYLIREQGVIPINEVDPLNPNPLPRMDMGPGWLVQSPLYYQHLRQFGVRPGMDLLLVSVNNPKMIYFFKAEDLSVIQDYLLEHYHWHTRFIPVEGLLDKTFSSGSHLYYLFKTISLN